MDTPITSWHAARSCVCFFGASRRILCRALEMKTCIVRCSSASGGEPGTAGVAPDIVLCVAVVSGTLAYVAPREQNYVHACFPGRRLTQARTTDGGGRMDPSATDRVSTHLLLFTKLEVELLHQGEPLMPAPRRTAR